MLTQRPRGRAFRKGVGGNPNGRRPNTAPPSERTANRALIKDVRQMCRAVGPEAVHKLIAWMRDTQLDPKLRVICAEALLDRGFGKPAQTLDVHADVRATVVRESARDIIASRLASIAERVREDSDPPRLN